MNERANIGSYTLRVRGEMTKQVFVYEDHRTILNVLDHLRRDAPTGSR